MPSVESVKRCEKKNQRTKMSTFLGQIHEIPGISIDRFNKSNLESTAYFLSHCHTDHMEGLGLDFFQMLINDNKYLYCSPISKAFLLGIYPGLTGERIIELELAVPNTIKYKLINGKEITETYLTVTTCAAGHCPGSVMFVFDKEDKSILYTGDFRIDPKDLRKLNPLNVRIGEKNEAKKFAAIYLDTTFMSHEFPAFPSRKESCDEICRAVSNWLKLDDNNVALLECSALYGAEYLFMEVSKLLKSKIHVKDKVYYNYTRIPELLNYATCDGSSARIHACGSKSLMSREKLSCKPYVERNNILTIVPSVQRWKGKNLSKFTEIDPLNDRRLYVCYSMHASLEELVEFVNYFKPDKIHPCVCPSDKINEVHDILKKLMSYREKSVQVKEDCNEFKLAIPMTRKISNDKPNFKSKYFNSDDDDDC